jgi:hypothetical protein
LCVLAVFQSEQDLGGADDEIVFLVVRFNFAFDCSAAIANFELITLGQRSCEHDKDYEI